MNATIQSSKEGFSSNIISWGKQVCSKTEMAGGPIDPCYHPLKVSNQCMTAGTPH